MWFVQWWHTWTCYPCQTWWSQKAELQEWKAHSWIPNPLTCILTLSAIRAVPLYDYFEHYLSLSCSWLLNSTINRNENVSLTLVEVTILVLRSTKLYFHLLVVQIDPSVFKSPPLVVFVIVLLRSSFVSTSASLQSEDECRKLSCPSMKLWLFNQSFSTGSPYLGWTLLSCFWISVGCC